MPKQIRMTISKYKTQSHDVHTRQAGDQYTDFFITTLRHLASPRVYVVHHRRKRREIKWYVVCQSAARLNWNFSVCTPRDKVCIPNCYVGGCLRWRARTMQPMLQHPRKIVAMDDAPDQRFFWIKIRVNHDKNIRSFYLNLGYCASSSVNIR